MNSRCNFFSPCWLFAIIGRQNFSPSFRYFLQNKEFQNFGPFFRFSFGSHFGSVPRVDWFGETENWFFSGENATNNQFWSVGKPKFIWREREAAASAAAALNCKQLESRKTEKKFRGLILLISFEKMIVYFFRFVRTNLGKKFVVLSPKIFLEKKLVRSRLLLFWVPVRSFDLSQEFFQKRTRGEVFSSMVRRLIFSSWDCWRRARES